MLTSLRALNKQRNSSKICALNESLATNVKDLEATIPVQDGPSRELAAAQQEIEQLEEGLQIEKRRSAKLERWCNKCKSELETTEQTDIAQLRLEKNMLLHHGKNLSSDKSSLESESRAIERVLQRLTTNQKYATPVPNTSQLPPGLFGIRGSSEPTSGLFGSCGSFKSTSGLFGIRGSAKPTSGLSGSHGFSVKSSNLQTYKGKQTLNNVTAFLFALEWHLKNAVQVIGWVGTMGWEEQAVLKMQGNAAVWAMHHFQMSTPMEWSTFHTELKSKFIPSNALDLVKCKWEELSLKKGERVTQFNECFHWLCWKLDTHQPMPAEMLANTYGYKIEKGNQRVYNDWVGYIGMHDRTPTL